MRTSDMARRLLDARKAAGLTGTDVYRIARVLPSVLSALERGRRKPNLNHLTRLAAAYRVPLVQLLGPEAQRVSRRAA